MTGPLQKFWTGAGVPRSVIPSPSRERASGVRAGGCQGWGFPAHLSPRSARRGFEFARRVILPPGAARHGWHLGPRPGVSQPLCRGICMTGRDDDWGPWIEHDGAGFRLSSWGGISEFRKAAILAGK